MAAVRPFRAIRYNLDKTGDLSPVVAPPYDIISPEGQEALYRKSPHNVVRLILAKDPPGGSGDDKYGLAGKTWRKWRDEGVLVRDDEPAIYVYRQRFREGGAEVVRGGFVALVRLEELSSGRIIPHEETMASPREDRMRLMLACHANLSPVYALFEDDRGEIGSLLQGLAGQTEMKAVDDQGVRSEVSFVQDSKSVEELRRLIEPKPLFIADGHHRYETALAYRELVRREHGGGDAPFDYIMMLCVSMGDPGLRILPAHRVVRGLKPEVLKQLITRAKGFFDVRELERGIELKDALEELSRNSNVTAFAVTSFLDDRFYLLKLRDREAMDWLHPGRSRAWRELDVGVLHIILLGEVLGMGPEEVRKGEKVAYERDSERVLRLVRSERYQVGVFHNPTRVEQLKEVTAAGERMPPKSTYFYPKPLSGLMVNSLESF